MYIVFFCSIICLFLTFQETRGRFNSGMAWGFAIITILGAIHYDYGNDYRSYYDIYQSVANSNLSAREILKGQVIAYGESGWHLLNYIFKYLGGFYVLVAALNVLQNWIIYRSIRKYVDIRWWPLSVFIYLFVTSFYLMEFSMMRQFIVMCVFLSMWPLINKRRWIIPLIVLYLCSFIHSSAIILFPFAFWGFLPVKNYRVIGILYVVVFGLLWFMGDKVGDVANYIIGMNETMENYTNTYGARTESLNFGLGFIMNLIPIVLSIIYIFKHGTEETEDKISMVILASIGYLVTPFSVILPMAGRLGMYFGMYKIVATPSIYANIKDKNVRYMLLGLLVFITLYDYYIFFYNPVWIDSYSKFQTIFEIL